MEGMDEDDPLPLRQRVDEVLQNLLSQPEYRNVYPGPWWDVPIAPTEGGPAPPRAWKRAVLRRRDSGGAEHWGHLFLIWSDSKGGAPEIKSVPLPGPVGRELGEIRLLPLLPDRAWIGARPVVVNEPSPIFGLTESIVRQLRSR